MDDITNIPNRNCKNCSHAIIESAKFCSNCGQKNTDGRISVGSFFGAFFSTVFNLESKFFKTLGHIFIPGKLTVEYFKGKHKSYFHPVRFFIVTALLLIAALGYQFSEKENAPAMGLLNNIHLKAEKQVRKEKFLAEMDKVAKLTLQKFPDSTLVKSAFDSLYQDLKGKDVYVRDSVDMKRTVLPRVIDNFDFKISTKDFVNLSPEALVDKYKIENRLDRFLFKQKIRLIKDKGGFAPFVLGNSLWIVLLMMPFLALILKVLYIRHGYYYVEHLVFSFHANAFAFLLFAAIGFVLLLDVPTWLIAIGFFILFVYLYMALKTVYGQGKFRTFVKLLIANVVYLALFILFLVVGVLTSMAMF